MGAWLILGNAAVPTPATSFAATVVDPAGFTSMNHYQFNDGIAMGDV